MMVVRANTRRLLAVVVCLLWLTHMVGANPQNLTVYDCHDPATTTKAIDLTEPELCVTKPTEFQEPIPVQIQILQADRLRPITAYRCNPRVTREITRCGYDSLQYGTEVAVSQQPIPITPAECLEAVDRMKFTFEGHTVKFKPGASRELRYYSHGELRDGDCQYVKEIIRNGRKYTWSYEFTTVYIDFEKVNGYADDKLQTVTFLNGLRALTADGKLLDANEGLMVWNTAEPDCRDRVSSVYQGVASLHRSRNSTGSAGHVEDVLVVANSTSKQYSGLVLKEAKTLCGRHGFRTHISGINVLILQEGAKPLKGSEFKAYMDTKTADLQSQIGYLHVGTNMRMNERFAAIWAAVCNVEAKTRHNKLQAMAAGDSPYSLMDTHGPGHLVLKAGAVAYVLACPARAAVLRDHHNCTQEIPVLVGNRTVFADPLSWILKEFPTTVPCDSLTPIRWKIHGVWYCGHPRIIQCASPTQIQLDVNEQTRGGQGSFTEGMGRSLYTETQKQAHRDFVALFQSREAVITDFAKNAMAGADSVGNFGLPFSSYQYHQMVDDLGNRFVLFYDIFGDGWTKLAAFLLCAGIIKIIIGTAIRTWILFKQRGVGWWMLSAIWHTLFSFVAYPIQVIDSAARAARDDVPQFAGDLALREDEIPRNRGGHGGDDPDEGGPPLVSYRELTNMVLQLQQELHRQQQRTPAYGDNQLVTPGPVLRAPTRPAPPPPTATQDNVGKSEPNGAKTANPFLQEKETVQHRANQGPASAPSNVDSASLSDTFLGAAAALLNDTQ